MVLVRSGWIHTNFRSFALVVCHRLQQRKLIPAKNEKHKKNKHTIKTQNHQKQPDKIHQKKTTKAKNKSHKKKTIKTWSLTSFDYLAFASLFSFCVLWYCIFLTAIFFMLFGSKAWYTKRFKTNSLQSFLARKKKKSQKCMKGRGDRPTPP